MDDDGFQYFQHSMRRSPPRLIGQMRTIKNLPPDSRLCVQIPTVIKSTAGFRHENRRLLEAAKPSRRWRNYTLYSATALRSNNWWCGHVYLAEDHPLCVGPARCRNINLWPGRSPCGNHQGIKPDFITLIALMTDNMSHETRMSGAWVVGRLRHVKLVNLLKIVSLVAIS